MSFQRQSVKSIFKKIENCWLASGTPLDFVAAMRRTLPVLDQNKHLEGQPIRWAALPGACCQAVGGDPQLVEDFAAAWFLFYVGAHLMDKIEDQEVQKFPPSELGPEAGINIASGLYFSASLLLEGLHNLSITNQFASEINTEFYNAFLRMCSGQQRDLARPAPSLSEYWEIAADKSGIFFSMACRLGARFGTSEQSRLESYGIFGEQVGILIQVLDDLEDFRESGAMFKTISFEVLRRSLPVIYALEVLPEKEADLLIEELNQAQNEKFASAAFERIEKSGASLYILAEIERMRDLAKTSLERAQPIPPAGEVLYGLLGDLTYQF